MDLTIPVGNTVVNIRVAVLIPHGDGYLFERHKDEYYYTSGGRIQAGESSLKAAKREIWEETGMNIPECDFSFVSIIENFFHSKKIGEETTLVQEICFVYTVPAVSDLPAGFDTVTLSKEEIATNDIRPAIIKSILLNDPSGVKASYIV
jgi:8-oxo-dGTP pyrophosphatase MutT (NUDIX family)